MARDLSDDVIAQKNAAQNRPIELYDLYLGSQTAVDSDTKFFCGYPDTISFFDLEGSAQDYTPIAGKRGPVKHNMDMAVDFFNFTLDSVQITNLVALVAGTDFRDKRLVIRKVFLDELDEAADAVILFDGKMDRITISEKNFNVQVISKINLKIRTGRFFQLLCPWTFGGTYCAFVRSSTGVTTQTCDAGCTTSVIKDAARGEADNYWKDGYVQFTSGENDGVNRRVTASSQSANTFTLDVALDNAPEAGDTYDLYQGCDKLVSTCEDRFSNQANFGGFHTIPVELKPEQ